MNSLGVGGPMNYLALIIAILFTSSFASAEKFYGDKMTMKSPTEIDRALADFNKGKKNDGEILVSGKVKSVCQKKGCWTIIESKVQDVRIKFKDYGFFVPKDIAGKSIWAQGVLKKTETSVKDARHYAKDAGKSKEEIAKITKPKVEFRFIASSVKIF